MKKQFYFFFIASTLIAQNSWSMDKDIITFQNAFSTADASIKILEQLEFKKKEILETQQDLETNHFTEKKRDIAKKLEKLTNEAEELRNSLKINVNSI